MANSFGLMDKTTEQMKKVESYITTGKEMTTDLTEELLKVSDDSAPQDELNILKDVMLQHLRMQQNIHQYLQAVNIAKMKISSECESDETSSVSYSSILESSLKETCQEITSEALQNTPDYKTFTAMIDDYLQPEEALVKETELDDDMILTQTVVIPKDPISQKEVSEPVKNKFCGHTYEKTTILQYIGKNKHVRCPYIGCSNAQVLKRDHLVENSEIKRLLERRHRQQEREGR
ncbi:E3 SUMO-protein ligase NSE2-like [Limulus polyphemus]|uniref:E3 SUMO-protein ligase NSE2 n=1 Tax=Limulus polyphemus TaxID=6850 RepID=A0ABM1BDG1_LIMPO|nr:E3 SUMO-protein ligase NSE2-like [Limulus polyphemus]XP_013779758.1 E3 SUMO-protein ligase NSE2-like [Limulus polyphemus]XP_013779759.1 E3 SUMO-protein ligase NSE2-like [Limulus polyphemus]XP_013779761.1 E3 SUMO-protein ligase NSE2-like [Limulus polyphemus]XP_022247588.1 E3 SUMO-protein ligase NSE2-like [Limulus polyphemus]XP_022247589.1 E3 SUMO-protein ligase NSE2-like [Limulus polyphemus]XP_022247590.1 E3 SUMO-protein ligase NSE2-like [Limulus polyphemus]